MSEPSVDFDASDQSDAAILRALKSASEGLLYPSESDEPFVMYVNPTREDVLPTILPHPGDRVTETTVSEFFAELIAGEDGSRFEQLQRVIESRLIAPRVFRIGEVTVDVYIVGRTPSGGWMGLHTVSVET